MSYVIGFLLVAGIVAFIGLPLLRPEQAVDGEPARKGDDAGNEGGDESLVRRKEQLLTALNELEYDFQMRKISPEDYRALKAGLTRQTVALFREEEAGEGSELKEIERAIEAEIQKEIERQLPLSKEEQPQ